MSSAKIEGRILLVDPEPAILMILKSILRDTVKHIEVSSNGTQALARLRSEDFDVLLCETVLPSLSGIDLLKALATESRLLPTIMVTRYIDRFNMLQALRGGAVDFIEKPFQEVVVKDAVKNALILSPNFLKLHRSHAINTRKLASEGVDFGSQAIAGMQTGETL